MPTFIVGDDLLRGDLVPLLLQWRATYAGARFTYPTRQFVPAMVCTFTEFLQREFAGEPA